MKTSMIVKKTVTICIFLSFLLLAFIVYKGLGIVEAPFKKEYELFKSIKVGMSEIDTINILGEPDIIYMAPTAPADYYVKGYSYQKRNITNKVFIYFGTEPIAYIYINKRNIVEFVFVGGS